MKFEGKVAIVTGSGRGIGECYAMRLAALRLGATDPGMRAEGKQTLLQMQKDPALRREATRFLAEDARLFAGLFASARQEVLCQERNIGQPLAERWQLDVDHIHTVIEVLAEPSVLNRLR